MYANVSVKVELNRPDKVKRTNQAVRTDFVGGEGREKRGRREEKDRRTVDEAVPRTV